MKQKAFVLQNKGMNRDLSISKVGESSAYENRNIRIIARDHDTLLSVTNERGNKEISLDGTIEGILIGWNVLNNHIILFTHEVSEEPGGSDSDEAEATVSTTPDRIYRIDYDTTTDTFMMIKGKYTGIYTLDEPLFAGNLNFNEKNPIESVVYSESDDINKIYWVDGRNVLRFMNFTEEGYEDEGDHILPWDGDNTYFDSNRAADFDVSVSISKDNAGSSRANGVVQYLITYFNKHGQETGHVWMSDLIYLSPFERGGAADETNNNKVTLEITGLDTSFEYFRVYSVFRSTKDGNTVSYLVSEQKTTSNMATVVDDGAHLTLQDTTRLLYLGSKPVIASTLAHKDQTLFLGDLKSTGRGGIDELERLIHQYMFDLEGGNAFVPGTTYKSKNSEFVYSESFGPDTSHPNVPAIIPEAPDIAYVDKVGLYPYENQLSLSSSEILTFKGGEKYRFALKFQLKDGTETDAFWIGDKENTLYPVIDVNHNAIKRVVFRVTIPIPIVIFLKNSSLGFKTVQLMIAEATYADRSVKAQGFVNPTMFNTWERYSKRIYSMPSWISRPRGSAYSFSHFNPVRNSDSSAGEIQCNYLPSGNAVPYFQYNNWQTGTTGSMGYTEEYEGQPDFTHIMLVNRVSYQWFGIGEHNYYAEVVAVKVTNLSTAGISIMQSKAFGDQYFWKLPGWEQVVDINDPNFGWYKYDELGDDGTLLYTMYGKWIFTAYGSALWNHGAARSQCYIQLSNLMARYGLSDFVIGENTFRTWCESALDNGDRYYNQYYSTSQVFGSFNTALNAGSDSSTRWMAVADVTPVARVGNMTPAYYKKHLMFVDENLVTLDSPEIAYNAINIDKSTYRFRIVGVAKMHSVLSDYTVDAVHGYLPGNNLGVESFSATTEGGSVLNGIISWPLWKEYSLDPKDASNSAKASEPTGSSYTRGQGIVRYWLYMWQHSGSITEYADPEDTTEYSILRKKTYANLRYSYNTIYLYSRDAYVPDEIRLVSEYSSNQYNIVVGTGDVKAVKYYDGSPKQALSMPGSLKYPVYYQLSNPSSTREVVGADGYYLSSAMPVLLEYNTESHALVSLPSWKNAYDKYIQTILPRFFSDEQPSIPSQSGTISGALLPWLDVNDVTGKSSSYPFMDYGIYQRDFIGFHANHSSADTLTGTDQYLFVAEIYDDYGVAGNVDNRYGGITLSAVEANRFVTAGPQYLIDDMTLGQMSGYLYANQGDTYFQRWDALRVKPFSNDSENNVIDITSVMLETHINLDGRTDLQRGIPELASIDITTFGQINPVYSQQNNFSTARDLDEDFNTDAYRSSLTWTLPKSDMADVDEWTHITLASSLKLDADKGICRALRRLQNSIIAFQDRGISEILYNSRTQLSTTDGVPVEIGNSGKVDGKRYITNKYGCINKWSIVEGKAALYFVDNINKAFCAFTGNAVDNLSTKLGFGVWFRDRNNTEPWNPSDENNFLSFFDRIHSDIYVVGKQDSESTEASTLVYNELLGQFTSFFDYGSVPMITNVDDRLVSFKANSLWRQNEGKYCNFFGNQYDFWVRYRVTPDPYGDKIWTNVEYRADFYRVLDGESEITTLTEEGIMADNNLYQPNETFSFMKFWNEYQSTVDEENYNLTPIKKFRTWRLAIPRAVKTTTNKYGLDRIRNPWMNLLFKKKYENASDATNQDLMQLHDIIVTYYE